MELSEIDEKIIAAVQRGDLLTPKINEIAKLVKKSPSTIYGKIKWMERKGLIKGYSARVDAEKLGRPLLADVYIKLKYGEQVKDSKEVRKIANYLISIPEVLELHIPVGRWNFIARVKSPSLAEHYRLMENKFFQLPIEDIESQIIMLTLKEGGTIHSFKSTKFP